MKRFKESKKMSDACEEHNALVKQFHLDIQPVGTVQKADSIVLSHESCI